MKVLFLILLLQQSGTPLTLDTLLLDQMEEMQEEIEELQDMRDEWELAKALVQYLSGPGILGTGGGIYLLIRRFQNGTPPKPDDNGNG